MTVAEPDRSQGVSSDMRTMRRLAFGTLWTISLALFMATTVLWARSYRTLATLDDADSISFTQTDPIWWIISYPGEATLCRQVGSNWDLNLNGFNVLGVRFGGGYGPGSLLWNLVVPYWMLAVVFAVLPVVRLELWRRSRREARRRGAGRCAKCGYDLRATPQRCSECGTIKAID